ncbi:urease accessory protein UreE [Allopusillimonas ginsengisoli]|nr:urease accessory protein UreE [Allopusillimonas ginsengisoli]
MQIALKRIEGTHVAKSLANRAPVVVLDFQRRRRSRQLVALENGVSIGLALPSGTVLLDGDLLVLGDGSLVVVRAAAESVLRVSGGTAQQLARAAYHLGNRHVPLEITASGLQLAFDAVLAEMLNHFDGIVVEQLEAPFEPETGAYGGGHRHGHDETFASDYALAQSVYHDHDDDHRHSHDHHARDDHERR